MLANHGYGNIISGIFAALSVKLFYRKHKYNLFEILILMCFVIGQGTLLLALTTLFFGILKEQWYQTVISIVSLGYSTWAIQQFFGGTKVGSYVKAFFALLFGQIMFSVAIFLVGLTVDLIIKML